MTTPSTNTPIGIIRDAFQDAALLPDEGQDLSPEQIAKGLRRLRDIILFFQTKGIKLWLNVDTAVPLVAGQAVYTFSPAGYVVMSRPLRAIQGYYLYTTTNVRRQISVMSWKDYLQLGISGTLTSARGTISQYFVNKKQSSMEVTFWLCPDTNEAANGQAHVLLQTQATVPTTLDETVNFPEEWRIALRWALAADLATGQPSAVIDRCEGKAELYRQALEEWDVEDTPFSVAPDPRSMQQSSFR